jgi:hypothetical protein
MTAVECRRDIVVEMKRTAHGELSGAFYLKLGVMALSRLCSYVADSQCCQSGKRVQQANGRKLNEKLDNTEARSQSGLASGTATTRVG